MAPKSAMGARFSESIRKGYDLKPALRTKYGRSTTEPPKPKNPMAARYGEGARSGFSVKPALRAKYGGSKPPAPPRTGMDVVRSSAGSGSVFPKVRRPSIGGDIFGKEFERTSPIGSATAMQRKSGSSLRSTLGAIKRGVSAIDADIRTVTSTLDADLRSTLMRPRDPARPNRPRRSPFVPVQPTRAGTQATNAPIPNASGPQATNARTGTNIPRVADRSRRLMNPRPAVFGSVTDSPMNKPGMLNIPRAGKKLDKIAAGADLPTPPGMKPQKAAPAAKPKKVKVIKAEPKPEKVSLPKPPKKVTPPKPTIDPTKTPDQTPERSSGKPTGSGGKGPSPKPTAAYREVPMVPQTDPTPRAPQSPAPPRAQAPGQRPAPTVKPKKRSAPNVLAESGPVRIVHEGGRTVRVSHASGHGFYVPYNPKKKTRISKSGAKEVAKELTTPSASDIREKEGPRKFVYDEKRDRTKMDNLFGGIKDEKRRIRAFEANEQGRINSQYEQRQKRLKTEFQGDITARRVAAIGGNKGGKSQLAIAKKLGLRALGPVAGAAGVLIGASDPAEALGLTVDQAGGGGAWAKKQETAKMRRESRAYYARKYANMRKANPLTRLLDNR